MLLVVASMIGTGVFTTTGILLNDITSPSLLLLVWAAGGFIALCGALSYGELVSMFPVNGGEYYLLSRIFHPAVGFVAGCVSFVVGFSAPIAAAALAFSSYMVALVPWLPPLSAAWALVVMLSLTHIAKVSFASRAQNFFTFGKLMLIVVFIIGGLIWGESDHLYTTPAWPPNHQELVSPKFAVGLILVSFAYSGWNAATYVAGELRDVANTLPLALIIGTTAVVLLYIGLNVVFLMSGPIDQLRNVVEVGHVAAINLFGPSTGKLLSATIALGLVSTVGAMIMTGPRIYEAMGRDFPALGVLALRLGRGGPAVAIALQASVSLLMIVTASFDVLLTFVGFMLSAVAGLTVAGVLVMRMREPERHRPYRTWLYPITPILFIAMMIWMVANAILERPVVAAAGVITVALSLGVYFLMRPKNRNEPLTTEPMRDSINPLL